MSREWIRSVRVDILVVTNKAEFRRRVDLDENETANQLLDRVRDRLHELDVSPTTSTTERRFAQAARLVAEHWGSQDGINARHLDDLVAAYNALTEEESNG